VFITVKTTAPSVVLSRWLAYRSVPILLLQDCAVPAPSSATQVKATAWICKLKSTKACRRTITVAALAASG
jgi:hypothetical protein